jgi:phosphatidylserine decarboxylase
VALDTPLVKIDRAAAPFVLIAVVPAAVAAWIAPIGVTLALAALPALVALFFRDPERSPPADRTAVLAPADGTVLYAGPARPGEAPDGAWQQVVIFLSVLDVHINRTPVAGTVIRVDRVAGSFRAAFRADAHRNEHSEIWLDHDGARIVTRQIVGVLARRVVCRLKPGDRLEPGARIGLMKFGSRMDVFVPTTAEVLVKEGDRVRGGETVIARLNPGAHPS